MPVGKHYEGSGEKVMRAMKRQYGPTRAKRIFYATENARKTVRESRRKAR